MTTKLLSPVAVEFALRARAAAILAARAPDRVQGHSRRLPTEAEQEQARFAARQFEIAADDLASGVLVEESAE